MVDVNEILDECIEIILNQRKECLETIKELSDDKMIDFLGVQREACYNVIQKLRKAKDLKREDVKQAVN